MLSTNMLQFDLLRAFEQARMGELAREILVKKHWEGCGGLQLSDEIRVTIAGEASLLLLGTHDLTYRNVQTILVYPSAMIPKRAESPIFALPTIVKDVQPVLGEAHRRGPVILAWDSVRYSGRHPEQGRNVVFHEFAHKLDLLDGYADGVPPLQSRRQYRQWVQICRREYEQLGADIESGIETLLDPYGATDPAEFFAVATECFFDLPRAMATVHPELYRLLAGFYRQDPAARQGGPDTPGQTCCSGHEHPEPAT